MQWIFECLFQRKLVQGFLLVKVHWHFLPWSILPWRVASPDSQFWTYKWIELQEIFVGDNIDLFGIVTSLNIQFSEFLVNVRKMFSSLEQIAPFPGPVQQRAYWSKLLMILQNFGGDFNFTSLCSKSYSWYFLRRSAKETLTNHGFHSIGLETWIWKWILWINNEYNSKFPNIC